MTESFTLKDSLIEVTGGQATGIPAVIGVSHEGPTWTHSNMSETERRNVEVIRRFWEVWKSEPFSPDQLREFFTTDVVVRTGWRGEHVTNGRDQALTAFAGEVQRQVEHDERSDFKIPVLIAKGPIVFHTWTWISSSGRLGYRFERSMAAFYLLRDAKIERWDSYATGKESAVGYPGGSGPDGL